MSLTRFRCANSLKNVTQQNTRIFFLRAKRKILVIGVGFEPTPPKRLVPKTSALDRSAIQPTILAHGSRHAEIKKGENTKMKMRPSGLEPESYPWKG